MELAADILGAGEAQADEVHRFCAGGVAGYSYGAVTVQAVEITADSVIHTKKIEAAHDDLYTGGVAGFSHSLQLTRVQMNAKVSVENAVSRFVYAGGLAGGVKTFVADSAVVAGDIKLAGTAIYAGASSKTRITNTPERIWSSSAFTTA